MRAEEAVLWSQAARGAAGNPFDRPEVFSLAREAVIPRLADLSSALSALCRGEYRKEARRLVLAAGHVQVMDGVTAPLDEGLVAQAVWRSLGVSRDALLALLLAADRCWRRLRLIVGDSPAMARLRTAVWQACFGASLEDALRLGGVIREQNVLILGETGTGKELVAAAIQDGAVGGDDGQPARKQAVNAAAIPHDLVESELFGHVRGAFSGALKDRKGKIAAASGGTLFLDEIGDLPPTVQPKLLRVVETDRLTPVGSNDEVAVDVRYVAATSPRIHDLVARGQFRRDLFERLAGVILEVAPLRERPEDLVAIGRAILAKLLDEQDRAAGAERPPPAVATGLDLRRAGIEAWLMTREARAYAWPGNVRELENAIRTRLMGGRDDVREKAMTPPPVLTPPPASASAAASLDRVVPERIVTGQAALEEVEDWYIVRIVRAADFNQSRAARLLGIDRGTLQRHMKRLGLRGRDV